jgi:hypothetical protein
MVNDELGRIWEVVVVAYFTVLSWLWLWGLRKTLKKPQLVEAVPGWDSN